ncbi:MAG: peptide chain release factor N(5)-glutamine methyltransferase [Treponema sp.]|nr:peptide chain release factor N(5)-glutamine methyltransferase [Treponema sp.]
MPCIKELLSRGKSLLASENISSPDLDTSLLLAEASGLSREQIYTHDDLELSEAQGRRFFEMLERRCRGECTAYILGRREFWGLKFSVTSAVLVPRPDTEILVEAALGILRSMALPRSILDLCTGSGAIAVALKHERPDLEVLASDCSRAALVIARKNAEQMACEITFFQGDLFDALADNSSGAAGRHFSLITANAPYVPSSSIAALTAEVRNEPRIALDGGADGLNIIRRIIAEAPAYLEEGGSLVLEGDPSQMTAMAALMNGRGFAEPKLYRDLAGRNRVMAAVLPRPL